jgi:hypothetical protein
MLVEVLEDRTLMSVSAVSLQVKVDRLYVQAALFKFKADIAVGTAKLLVDTQTLKADGLKNNPTFTPLFAQLHTDVKNMDQQLRLDRLNESAAVLQDESAITLELAQILKDKAAGNTAAVASDQQTLLADRVKLQDDEIAGLTNRINTRETDYTTISTDIQNILGAANALSPSDPLQAAINKFATDRMWLINKIPSDLTQLMTDRSNLADALTAEET